MLMTVLRGEPAIKQGCVLVKIFKNSPTGVNITLFSDNIGNNKLHNIEFTDFCKEYPYVKISLKKKTKCYIYTRVKYQNYRDDCMLNML